jgi:arsenate reductase
VLLKDGNMLYPEIQIFIEEEIIRQEMVPSRLEMLQPIIHFIRAEREANRTIQLQFICTHNSRRSHLAQIWAQVAASYHQVPFVYCYSGGTIQTSIYGQILSALSSVGFQIHHLSEGVQTILAIQYSDHYPPVIGFSKKYDHPFQPVDGFAAIMTCSEADQGCPSIPGASARFALPYEDPKFSDGSYEEAQTYLARSLQIASEMFYVFGQIKGLR